MFDEHTHTVHNTMLTVHIMYLSISNINLSNYPENNAQNLTLKYIHSCLHDSRNEWPFLHHFHIYHTLPKCHAPADVGDQDPCWWPWIATPLYLLSSVIFCICTYSIYCSSFHVSLFFTIIVSTLASNSYLDVLRIFYVWFLTR